MPDLASRRDALTSSALLPMDDTMPRPGHDPSHVAPSLSVERRCQAADCFASPPAGPCRVWARRWPLNQPSAMLEYQPATHDTSGNRHRNSTF